MLHLFIPTSSQALTTTYLFIVSIVLPFPECHVVGIVQYAAFFLNFYFIYFLAVLGLRCCTQAFSSCGEPGLLFVAVCGLLIAVASLVVEHGL